MITRSPHSAPSGRSKSTCTNPDSPGAIARAPSTATRLTRSSVPRWKCTGNPSRTAAGAARDTVTRRSRRLAAFGDAAGQVQRTALALPGLLDRPVMGMDPAHPQLDPARAEGEPVTDSNFAGSRGAGHHQPDPREREGTIDREAKAAGYRAVGARCVGGAGGVAQMLGERRDALAVDARDRVDRAVGISGLAQQRADFGFDGGAAL